MKKILYIILFIISPQSSSIEFLYEMNFLLIGPSINIQNLITNNEKKQSISLILQCILYDKNFTKFIQPSFYVKFNIKSLHQFGIQCAHLINKKIIFAIIFYYEQGIFFQINIILNNISKKQFIPNLIHIKPIPKCKYNTIFIQNNNNKSQQKFSTTQTKQTSNIKQKIKKCNVQKIDFTKDYLSKRVRIPLRTSNYHNHTNIIKK